MKEYEKYVIWLDYFNSELRRSEGRRVPLSSATRSPSVEELSEACRRLNLQPVAHVSKYPGSPTKQSGYLSVAKSKPKQALVINIARELSVVRGIAQRRKTSVRPSQKKS